MALAGLEIYQNIFSDDWETLWIAYGVSILSTALAVIAGMTTLIQSGESYRNNFSTIVRVSRTAELSVEVMGQDGSGRDPLPAYLKDARIDIGVKSATANDHDMVETLVEE